MSARRGHQRATNEGINPSLFVSVSVGNVPGDGRALHLCVPCTSRFNEFLRQSPTAGGVQE